MPNKIQSNKKKNKKMEELKQYLQEDEDWLNNTGEYEEDEYQ